MPNFQLPHMDYIARDDARYAETFRKIQDVINTIALQGAMTPEGPILVSLTPTAITVTGADGIFDIQIQDNNPSNNGVAPDYFLEYATDASFTAPSVVHLGPSRNWRRNLGNQTLYWRAYSQIGRASQPSDPIYPANNPVVGGGAGTGPTVQPSAGSGTAPTNGLRGGSGYGRQAVRNQRVLD